MRRPRLVLWSLLVLFAASACRGDDGAGPEAAPPDPRPPAPSVPSGPLGRDTAGLVDEVLDAATTYGIDRPAVEALGASGDPRLAWLLADLLRLYQDPDDVTFLVDAFAALTGVRPTGPPHFVSATDALLAWDLPAPPAHREHKGRLFTAVEPAWAPFFADTGSAVDWRAVTWGGVQIDDRTETVDDQGRELRCAGACIPALDDPTVTSATSGDWLADDAFVFGVVVDGDARAYPVHQLETHELVNDELGGRRIALVFCTLCRSAQAWFTDDVDPAVAERFAIDHYTLRTSGLLQRSNKLGHELATSSLVDSFTGRALSGPLRDAGVVLEQVSVVTSTWSAWRTDHPGTTIVAEDGGIGRDYDLDPLGDRDEAGPIFPVGDVDPRLGAQDQVVGVVAPDGTPVAFPVVALATRRGDESARAAGVRIVPAGSGHRAESLTGDPLVSHQAFWFAWSQFHPGTVLWSP